MNHTIKYKSFYIHISYVSGEEVILIQSSTDIMPVKSLHAAKLMITKLTGDNR